MTKTTTPTTTPVPVPTWEQEKTLLPTDLTGSQIEAVRKAGARRRHIARITAARREVEQLCDKIVVPGAGNTRRWAMYRLLMQAIEASIASIGLPGSACGTSPPGWYRNTRNVGARVAALREVLAIIDAGAGDHDLRVHAVDDRELVIMDYQLNDPTIGRIDPEWGPEFRILAEYVAAQEIARRSAAVDAWIAGGGQGPVPSSPPQDVLEFHAQLVESRRARAGAE